MPVIDRYQLLRKYRKPNIHPVEGKLVIYVGNRLLSSYEADIGVFGEIDYNKRT